MALAARKVETPQPFSWAPSQFWEGNDGAWSTFIIRVGTPAQTFRILPSTASEETWVPAPEECPVLNLPTEECGDKRGVQVFENAPSGGFMVNEVCSPANLQCDLKLTISGQSSSWDSIGLYELGLEENLNYTGNGRYGFETIGLEIQNSGGLTLEHQIVAGTASEDFMLGVFGLGQKPTNFSDYNDPQSSYMWSLKNQSLIPSLSFGYSAGAPYRNKGVLGSLTLGGYDAAKFEPNNFTFTFGPDTSASLLVGLQSIQADNTLNGVVSLLPKGILSLVDSTVPEIWLPVEACTMFETSFGIVHDPHTDRYLVNDTIHSQLQNLQPTLTFQLGNAAYGGESINIVLPYSAFDLQANYPIYPNATNYFPLRRAANDSQYVIGRTFLQESYIAVDYERQNFTISQSVFPEDARSNIIPILPPTSSKLHSGLSHAALIGVIVACVLVAIFLLAGGAFMFHKRKQRKRKAAGVHTEEKIEEMMPSPEPVAYEVLGSKTFSQQLHSTHVTEMEAGIVHEIGGTSVMPELPATIARPRNHYRAS